MPELHVASWIVWVLLSAAFAALTAIFAKVGIQNINSDLATFIRTVVILIVLVAFCSCEVCFDRYGAFPDARISSLHCRG